jgi:hypothetical protein
MDQGQFEAKLAETETRLRRLRLLYDQWFHGLERAEPQNQRREIDRLIADLKNQQVRNTALKFRLNQLVQRYMTYHTYWQRITRQIEEGTYKRDVLRARRRFGPGKGPAEGADANRPDAYDLDLDIDVEAAIDGVKSEPPPGDAPATEGSSSSLPPARSGADRVPRALRDITPFALPSVEPRAASGPLDAPVFRPQSGPLSAPLRQPSGPLHAPPLPAGVQASLRPKGAPPPVPPNVSRRPPASSLKPAVPPAGGNGMSDEQLLNLYQRYVSARRDNKERTDNVRIETVAKTVRDMMPKLKEKHAGKQIDFEIVVKDGRVALKPVPK